LEQEEEEGPITSVVSDGLAAFTKARQLDGSTNIKAKLVAIEPRGAGQTILLLNVIKRV